MDVNNILKSLEELNNVELSIVKQKIVEIRRSRSCKQKYQPNEASVKEWHKDRMVAYNPYLSGKL